MSSCISTITDKPAQAYVSAVMESIEIWHLEYAELVVEAIGSACDVGLAYDLRALSLAPNSPVSDRTPLEWVAGRGLRTGTPTLAPAGAIRLDMTSRRSWDNLFFLRSSNGTATGNVLVEAVLHGLLEVIERGCVAAHMAAADPGRQHVNPESAQNPTTRRIVDAVARAGCSFETIRLENPYGIACFAAQVWSEDVPVRCGGFGCHVDPEVAFGRALSEAAQSRLATVSGARDDIDEYLYRPVPDFAYDSRASANPIDDGSQPLVFDDIEAVVNHCVGRIEAVTGIEPFAIDLTQHDIGIPTTTVIAPGVPLCDFTAYRH